MLDDKKILFLGDSICRHYFEYSEEYLKQREIEAITPEKWVTVQWQQGRLTDGLLQNAGIVIYLETVCVMPNTFISILDSTT